MFRDDDVNWLSPDELKIIANNHKLPYVDLTGMAILPSVIAFVPESIARENLVLPLALENGALKVAMSDPTDFDMMQKLQFILSRDIRPVLSSRQQIIDGINRHYGHLWNWN